MAKTLREMIEVMQTAERGEEIEWAWPGNEQYWWSCEPEPDWDWVHRDFRVKPKPREIWCNEYRTSSKHESYLTGKHYNSRDEAEAGVSGYDRIAIVRFVEAERIPVSQQPEDGKTTCVE